MSLQTQLNAIKEGAAKKIPPDMLKVMLGATDALRDSGIMDSVIKVGSKLPPFTLNNQNGVAISSETLLSRGAVVLTVFRGHW
ncbi:MAG: hypothetical protein ACI915_004474 [Gammaproteobacteria bacterium]|jgi:cytochrome oxidase Cu insertion factor (SCO1/SenC/PrrC family)